MSETLTKVPFGQTDMTITRAGFGAWAIGGGGWAFAAAGLPHRVELEVNDVHTLLDLIGHNLGIAIVPAPIAAKKRGKLHVSALRGDLPGWHVAAAASENPSPAARALLAQLSHRHEVRPAEVRPASPPGPAPRPPQPVPG